MMEVMEIDEAHAIDHRSCVRVLITIFGEAVLMMELPRRHSTPPGGGAGSHPLRVQTMVGGR